MKPGVSVVVVFNSEGNLENSVFALGKPEHKKPHKGGFARVFE
jgi:hypothetical protein